MNKKLLILVVVLIVLVLGGLAVNRARLNHKYSAHLQLQIAPSDSLVTLNNKAVHGGTVGLVPGAYSLQIARTGFGTATKNISLSEGQSLYIGIALVSNSLATATWYNDHPNDQAAAEQISSRNFDQASDQLPQAIPLVKKLPYVAAGSEFRVDYGPDPKNSSKTVIFITAQGDQGYQDALVWIKQQGTDPSSLNITVTKTADQPTNNLGN